MRARARAWIHCKVAVTYKRVGYKPHLICIKREKRTLSTKMVVLVAMDQYIVETTKLRRIQLGRHACILHCTFASLIQSAAMNTRKWKPQTKKTKIINKLHFFSLVSLIHLFLECSVYSFYLFCFYSFRFEFVSCSFLNENVHLHSVLYEQKNRAMKSICVIVIRI